MKTNDFDSKELIKKTTKKMIIENGIRGFNMRKLAQNTDLSLGTIYYHFPSKGALIIELVDEFWLKCFDDIPTMDKGILASISQLFTHIHTHFLSFSHDWLQQLAELSIEDKKNSRKYEAEYMEKVKGLIETLIKNNIDEISEDTLEMLGQQGLTEFIFHNFMFYLRSEKADTNYLCYVIKKVIN